MRRYRLVRLVPIINRVLMGEKESEVTQIMIAYVSVKRIVIIELCLLVLIVVLQLHALQVHITEPV